ncbi:MAG: iron-containing redox enzyme family protein [Polyangiales bacterium]
MTNHDDSLREFWLLADAARTQTAYLADERLKRLATVPLPVLRKIFVQYRYFTIFYITDLALLVAKLPFGELRSLLADFLNDELGNGDNEAAHERLYDNFLLSIGIPAEELALDANQENMRLLLDLQTRVVAGTAPYAVGLRGMGGECLCQVYLAAMHAHFVDNPAIRALSDRVSWTFWDIHTGDVDIAHREKLKASVETLVTSSPEQLDELIKGYRDAKAIFDKFWENIYAEHFADLRSAPTTERAEPTQARA